MHQKDVQGLVTLRTKKSGKGTIPKTRGSSTLCNSPQLVHSYFVEVRESQAFVPIPVLGQGRVRDS